MADSSKYHERANEIADTLRSFLVAIHTGGIGVVLAVAGSLASEEVQPSWAVYPALIFCLGLLLSGSSLLLAKHKALQRKKAAEQNTTLPDYETNWLWRNFTWDAVNLGLFLTGALAALYQLQGIEVSCL